MATEALGTFKSAHNAVLKEAAFNGRLKKEVGVGLDIATLTFFQDFVAALKLFC